MAGLSLVFTSLNMQGLLSFCNMKGDATSLPAGALQGRSAVGWKLTTLSRFPPALPERTAFTCLPIPHSAEARTAVPASRKSQRLANSQGFSFPNTGKIEYHNVCGQDWTSTGPRFLLDQASTVTGPRP